MIKTDGIGWRCPTNDAGEGFGFNESGMEHFAGDPFSALAREITQNTNDAVQVSPAFLQFKTIQVSKSDFPNRDEFVEILTKCRVAADEEGQKASVFFDSALEKIDEEKITFLVARDKNTTGILGPCKKGTPYHAFMKSTGTSKKSGTTSGGSFGIGKNAPYANSDFRTVFVLTRYKDEFGQLRQLAQGKSILMSHGNDGTEFTNNAYWGEKDGFSPLVDDVACLPDWMTNPFNEKDPEATTGTTIFVAGFRSNVNWDKIITAYIIQNFFSAIQSRNLVVEVGRYSINETTIADLFCDEGIEKAISDFPSQPEGFQFSNHYFQCLNSNRTIHETSQQPHLGKTNVGILLGDGYPRKVAFIRNGMLITDNLYRLQKFPGMKDFVAVVECNSTSGNKFLRLMESVRHDEFQPERLATEAEKIRGRSALKQLSDFVRKQLNQHARNAVEKEFNLKELSGLLGSDAVGVDPTKEGEANPAGKLVLSARPKPAQNQSRKSELLNQGLGEGFNASGKGGDLNERGDGGQKGAIPSGTGEKDGVGTGDRTAGDGGKAGSNKGGDKNSQIPMLLHDVRGIRLNSNSRRIFFMPPTDGKIRISFERVGADTNLPLEIKSVSTGKKLDDRTVEMYVTKMAKTQVDVTFKNNFEGAVKVVTNAI